MPGNSQTVLNDTNCVVPCATLKNALIMRSDYKLTQAKLLVARDTISILTKKGLEQDSIILDYSNLVVRKDSIIQLKSSVIVERESEIKDLNKNITTLKNQRNGAIIGGGVLVILTIILGVVF